MKSITEDDYRQRLLRVLIHIQEHLDEDLPLEDLAKIACFSPYHFHRVFRGMVGEPLQKHVRRLRLERSAQRLKLTDHPVIQIAFEAGYESHEAFTRSFRTLFGESPREFRQSRQPATLSKRGVHYQSDPPLSDFEPVNYEEPAMEVKRETLEPRRVVFMRHVGPYDQVGDTWSRLFGWAFPRGLAGPQTIPIGVLYDDPDVTPPERLRYDACLPVDRLLEPEGAIALQQIAGGDYAVTQHVGPYQQCSQTYARLFGEWLPQSGREVRSAPSLEFYRNSPLNTPPEKLITDIYIPLEK